MVYPCYNKSNITFNVEISKAGTAPLQTLFNFWWTMHTNCKPLHMQSTTYVTKLVIICYKNQQILKVLYNRSLYHMASYVSRQDEPNPTLWLATWVARWSYLARSGLPAVSHKKNFPKSDIINPLLIKLVQSRWLNIGLVLFFVSL